LTEQSTGGTPPADLVQVGFVFDAYGVAGAIRVRPFSDDAGALLKVKTWWLDKPAMRGVAVRSAKLHGGDVVTQLDGLADRDAAEALKGASVFIARSLFPALPENEYYWSDLIGLDVVNLQGEALGKVADMMHNGAQSILRVAPGEEGAQERLIPFVDHFVKTVDQSARTITVDWGLDF
jgi:16S rRNA processing protein RimM